MKSRREASADESSCNDKRLEGMLLFSHSGPCAAEATLHCGPAEVEGKPRRSVSRRVSELVYRVVAIGLRV